MADKMVLILISEDSTTSSSPGASGSAVFTARSILQDDCG